MASEAPDSAIPVLTDFAALRAEGLRQLERLAGSGWTDFNEHDPGITILEQYCYALTELAYRCDFPLPDLLSREGKDPYASLHSPAKILSSRPVTLTDLRKLAVDVRGVNNAWIEPVAQADPQVFHNLQGVSPLHDRQESLVQMQPGEGAAPVKLKGLYRVLIEPSPALGVDNAEITRNVARRLHAHRPLCMDFDSIQVLDTQKIQVKAAIEIGESGNPEDIYVAILGKIAGLISPAIPFHTLQERLAEGLGFDEIFDGPPLDQGFIDTSELQGLTRKTALRCSDFVRAIMEVEGVVLVKQLALNGGKDWEEWWLDLAEGKTPILDIENSPLRLERRQIEVNFDHGNARQRHRQAQAERAYRPAKPEELDAIPPAGRDRGVGRYYSAQHQFPEVYGLGERGLPPQADGQRRAQLRQLQAYLLIFDQLLANQFAQLAHVGDLLGFGEENPQTYFAHPIEDPSLKLEPVWKRADVGNRRERLGQIVENPAAAEGDTARPIDWNRKNRFLDHLLARFAEQFADPAQYRQDGVKAGRWERLARDKQAWLREYPRLGAGRGSAADALAAGDEAAGDEAAGSPLDSGSVLEQRLRLKLGLRDGNPEESLYLIEHLLLRPFDADLGQQALPLLADARCADAYSLQVSVVLADLPERYPPGGGFRRYIAQTVREEIPAHLLAYICWLDGPRLSAFISARQTWLDCQRRLREGSDQKALRLPLDGQDSIRLGVRLRDARDRLVDLLGLGQTYPLADLPVSHTDTVAWGESGLVTLTAAQSGVFYQLLGKDGKPLEPPVDDIGTGGDLKLSTPAISSDIDFIIKAGKPHSRVFAASLGDDGKIHCQDSRLDTRYELLRADGSPFEPAIQATGNGEELIFTPPAAATDKDFMLRAVKTLSVTLFQAITIKVGLDIHLQATIVGAEWLEPSSKPGPADPRLVDYGVAPQVEIKASQAGVDYSLAQILPRKTGSDAVAPDPLTGTAVPVKLLSAQPVRGDSHDILLQARPCLEDTDIRILATRRFDNGTRQETQTTLLKVVLPLKVRPNPALPFTLQPPWLDYRARTQILIKATQNSASYQLASRLLLDSEYLRDGQDPAAISLDGMASLWLKNPPNPTPDAQAVGKPKPGSGAELALGLDDVREDTLVVVAAAKSHQTPDGSAVASSLQLVHATAVLVKPGAFQDFPLRLRTTDGNTTASLGKDSTYLVQNGQPGVFYHFRLAGTETDLGLPVYFHKDGKGIGGLAVEIDLAITDGIPTPPPEWDCPLDLDAEARLSIRAVKAQTGLETVFELIVGDLLATD